MKFYDFQKPLKNLNSFWKLVICFLSGLEFVNFIKMKNKANHIKICLCTLGKNENNEIKNDYNHILNHNVIVNKKFSNCNLKNKYNLDNKIFKSNIGNFSYPSYNSTTSSGGKFKNK